MMDQCLFALIGVDGDYQVVVVLIRNNNDNVDDNREEEAAANDDADADAVGDDDDDVGVAGLAGDEERLSLSLSLNPLMNKDERLNKLIHDQRPETSLHPVFVIFGQQQ